MPAILRRSNGTQISGTPHTEYTNRMCVHVGDGAVTNAGDKTFNDVKLIASKDSAYLSATSNAPVLLGVDNVHFIPKRFPET